MGTFRHFSSREREFSKNESAFITRARALSGPSVVVCVVVIIVIVIVIIDTTHYIFSRLL